MAQTVTITQSEYRNLLNRITRMEKLFTDFMKNLQKEPTYGTDAWWEWAHKKGMEALEKGDYTEITTEKQRESYFKSL